MSINPDAVYTHGGWHPFPVLEADPMKIELDLLCHDPKDTEIAKLKADLVFLKGIDEARERVSLALGIENAGLRAENAELRDKIAFLYSRMPFAKPERLQHSEALSRALAFSNIPDGYGRPNTRAR